MPPSERTTDVINCHLINLDKAFIYLFPAEKDVCYILVVFQIYFKNFCKSYLFFKKCFYFQKTGEDTKQVFR